MLGTVLSWLFGLLTTWYIWMPIVGVLAYLTYRNHKRASFVDRQGEHTLLTLEIPKTNDKQELAAEQMFASLHGILRDKHELSMTGGYQEHISFEIAAIGKYMRFYVWVPKHLQNFVEGQIYAQYPSVQIHEAEEDYTQRELVQPIIYGTQLNLSDYEMLPIKTFQSFEVDPLAGITATLAKLDNQDEEMWIQVLARPIADNWHKRASQYASNIRNGNGGGANLLGSAGGYLLKGLAALWAPPVENGSSSSPKELSERDKTRISEVEKKSTKLGYQVKIRLMYLGQDNETARLRMQAIVGTFKQFNSTNLNGFSMRNPTFSREVLAEYAARLFIDRGYVLNIEELASVYHLPHTNVETPNIVWASTKTAEPPAKLPVLTGDRANDDEISAYGLTNFRGINQQFGLYRSDRGRHIYVIGQTGTGKSGLLELFALSDVFHNQGYAIIDPHGDFAVNNMRFIPAHRINDVVYFNPADTAFPIGFNPMEINDPSMINNTSSEIIGVLKRMFGEVSWGPRLEYILRYTILALLYYPNSTMLDITRMLTDKKFREDVLTHCEDTVVLNFWKIEFASWNDKFASEAVAPVLNKVGAFTANPIIRNIIGQPKSSFDIRKIMDEGKILIVNLSKGLIGEDNASILGSFIVTKIQLAAMSRADIPHIDDRRPFYLYVDEFQNFATDSFATILSEARKYGLNLTVANQYISQMSDTVRDAVFGNVGTSISFRVSADDAPMLGKQFEPQFEPADLLQMHNRHFVVNMVIKGEKVPAFSATTLQLPSPQTDYSLHIIENTRANYAKRREDVAGAIDELMRPPEFLRAKNPLSTSQAKQWPTDRGAKPAHQQSRQQNNNPQPKTVNANNDSPRQMSNALSSGPRLQLANPDSTKQTSGPDRPNAPEYQQAFNSADDAPRKRSRNRSRKKKGSGGNDDGSNQNSPVHADDKIQLPRQSDPASHVPERPKEVSVSAAQKSNDDHELRLR